MIVGVTVNQNWLNTKFDIKMAKIRLQKKVMVIK